MGQQYIGGTAQNPYVQQQPVTPRPTPYSTGYPGGTGGGMPVDPRIAQALANPNGGDVNQVGGGGGGSGGGVLGTLVKTLPGPMDMVKGAGLGAVVGMGFYGLTQPWELWGKKLNSFEHIARVADDATGGQWVKQRVDPFLQNLEHPALREFFMSDAIFTQGADQKTINNAVRSTVDKMERRKLEPILKIFQSRLKNEHKQLYKEVLKECGHDQSHWNLAEGKPWEKHVIRTVDNTPGANHILEEQLNRLVKMPQYNSKEGRALYNSMREALHAGTESYMQHYTPLYESTAKLTAEMSARGIGPVGRGIRSFTNGLQRIFTGETMGWAASQGSKLLSPAPIMIGGMILAFPFKAAKDAPHGEKTKAFFQNLMGSQIFNLIGWDVGRRILNAVDARRIFGRFTQKTPFHSEWLERGLGKIFGGLHKIMPHGWVKTLPQNGWLRKGLQATIDSMPSWGRKIACFGPGNWGLGGIVIEIAAGFLLGSLFEKGAHWALNKMGFKLKNPDSNDPGKKPSASANPMPSQLQQAQAGQGGNPVFANAMNPAFFNQAQSPGLQNSPYSQYGKPGPANWPAANPAGMQPTAPAGAPNYPAGAPTSKAYDQSSQSQSVSQQPMLSPEEIMQNRATQSNDDFSQQLSATSPSFDKSIRDILSGSN